MWLNFYRTDTTVAVCGAGRSAGAGVPRGLERPRAGHSGQQGARRRGQPGAPRHRVGCVGCVGSGADFHRAEGRRETENLRNWKPDIHPCDTALQDFSFSEFQVFTPMLYRETGREYHERKVCARNRTFSVR
jgi:hypothetical protein